MDFEQTRWSIETLDSFQDELNGEDCLESALSDALKEMTPSNRIREILKPVTEGLSEMFSTGGMYTAPAQYADNTEADKANREVLITRVIGRLNNKIDPVITEMDKYLFHSGAQTYATNQHNEKLKDDVYRKQVIMGLQNLAKMLPGNHPVRLRIENLR